MDSIGKKTLSKHSGGRVMVWAVGLSAVVVNDV